MDRILDWIRQNWSEESNMGKAKLGALAALLFLLIASILPGSRQPHPDRDAASGDVAKEVADTYTSYETRVGELERAAQDAAQQAADAYKGYELRVGELERERKELQAKLDGIGALDTASAEAAEAYQGYEARIIELEQQKREMAEQMAKLEAGGESAREAAEAYAAYEARVGELEQQVQAAADEAAETYQSYEARVSELEHETQSGQQAAAETYSTYERRIADLERQNKDLLDQLAVRDARIAELQQGADSGGEPVAAMEMRLQLEAMRGTLDQLLKRLESTGSTQTTD